MTGIDAMVSRVQQLHSLVTPERTAGTGGAPGGATSAGDFAATLARARGLVAGTGTPPAGAGFGSPGATGSDVVAGARRYLGVPYVWGGTDPASGLDCSGLVQRVYADLGVSLPRVSRDQARAGQPVASMADARPGDVLAFHRPVDHVAIYIGDGQMIAAPEPGDRVKVQRVYETPTAIRRILPDAGAMSWSLPVARPAGLPGGLSAALGVGSGAEAAVAGVPYAGLFNQAAARYGLPPALLAAVAQVESGYNPRAVSSAGARGLMQLMPGTAAGLGVNPLDPGQAVDGAARLLSKHLGDFKSLPVALAAYNAGAGAVRKYGGIPPYPETQAYVGKVQAALAALTSAGLS